MKKRQTNYYKLILITVLLIFATGETIQIAIKLRSIELNDELINAAANNDTNRVILLLSLGANASSHRSIHNSFLQRIINLCTRKVSKENKEPTALIAFLSGPEIRFGERSSNHILLNALIDNGANINAKDSDGKTVLMWAAWMDTQDPFNTLLIKGADVNARDKHEPTLLMIAANGGHDNLRIAKALLDNGADPNIRDDDGFTALMSAAMVGNNAVIKLLIARNANIDIKSNDGDTAFEIARRGGFHSSADLLNINHVK